MLAPASHRAIVVSRHRLLWGGLLAVVLLAGCGKKESQPEPGVLAKGDGWSVRSDDFRHWWNTRPGPADSPQARTEALDRLVERATLAAAARQAGLERDPETVARIEAILITRLQEVQLAPQLEAVTVSEDEVRAVYDARRESAYTQPEAVRVAVLWFNTRGQQPLVDRYRPRLEQIRAEVSATPANFPSGAGFGTIAVGNTEHRASRLMGGDLGWLEVAAGSDAWRNAVLRLAVPLKNPGDLSGIEAGGDGLFLVRLIERRAAAVKPFESVRAEIRTRLLEERREQLREDFTRRLLAAAKPQRFPQALDALVELPPRAGTDPAAPEAAGDLPPFPTEP
jgi:parvulin-like peptidyl-prolyl isomerase